MFSYILSKRPANLFDGSYFFLYICYMEEIKIIGVFFLCVSVWMIFEIWRAPTYDEKSNGKFTEIESTKKLSNLFKRRKK